MLEQKQVSSVVPSLSALLAHPDFQEGLKEGRASFSDSYEAAPLSEEEMIEEVEMNVSRRITMRSFYLCSVYGWEASSYLYNLGVVLGTIDEGLAHAR